MSDEKRGAPPEAPQPRYRITDLSTHAPGWRRWLHGLLRTGAPPTPGVAGTPVPGPAPDPAAAPALPRRAWVRFASRVLGWVWDQATSSLLDAIDGLRPAPPAILRVEDGFDPMPGARAVAVMVQYSPSGQVSEMVLQQLAAYRALGFAVVLVSNSPAFPEESWQAVRAGAALVVHRRNRGLDFGAWRDLVPVALERWPGAEELLLVNDSVLGPIRPLGPVLDALRAEGPGFFGMLESIQGGPHLQSWFTLARGHAAVRDAAAFLASFRPSRSKWKIVQRGELRMARAMRAAGHRVGAVHGYESLIDLALADPAERAYLARAVPFPITREALLRRPLNPAHHLWRVLAGPAGCPFVKTELVRRNPWSLPDLEQWSRVLSSQPASLVEVVNAHLKLIGEIHKEPQDA